jgi:hypothetical protein
MLSSGMTLVGTNVSEVHIVSISELGTTLIVTSTTVNVVPGWLILSTLMMEVIHCSKTSVLTRATPHHIPEDRFFI